MLLAVHSSTYRFVELPRFHKPPERRGNSLDTDFVEREAHDAVKLSEDEREAETLGVLDLCRRTREKTTTTPRNKKHNVNVLLHQARLRPERAKKENLVSKYILYTYRPPGRGWSVRSANKATTKNEKIEVANHHTPRRPAQTT